MIRGVGFSGTADIIWGVGFLEKMSGKFVGGVLCEGILHRYKNIALPVMRSVDRDNGKHCCIGRMIVGGYSCTNTTDSGFCS